MLRFITIFLLVIGCNIANATQQEWFSTPLFDWIGDDLDRTACIIQEIETQFPPSQNQTISMGLPVPKNSPELEPHHYAQVDYGFCFIDSNHYCERSFSITLTTSDPKGWTIAPIPSFSQAFITAHDVVRFADIVNLKNEKVGILDINNCKQFFGIQ